MSNPVQIKGQTGSLAIVDDLGAIVTAAETRLRNRDLLEGHIFVGSVYDAAVGTGGDLEALIITPSDKTVLATIDVGGVQPGTLSLFESPTVTANGTAALVINRNLGISPTYDLELYQGPTISADGTLLIETIVIDIVDGSLVIFKQDTTYLIRLHNEGAGPGDPFNISLNWIEG